MSKFWREEAEEGKDQEDATFLPPTSTKQTRKLQGWRFGVLTCTTSTCFIFIINTSLAISALAKSGWENNGQPTLYKGNCNTVSKLNTGVHLLINEMSTSLLCARSYDMQCLSAPTRQELDRAHSSHFWLDIGVSSPRNIQSISKSRRRRWLILGLSTIPLHLL
jgi:hypothetical protein